MTERARITVVVGPDGHIRAATHGVTGTQCLPYVAVLEDLLEATAVDSAYTADWTTESARVANSAGTTVRADDGPG
ncbi:DUF2997 domain-containing protein [Skermania piniformis]|uniref:DUF2997 domain-containing protein n=1 Tax=Skermania pinensis TaxID=39122 RepID=A0ABX8S661_9ACTN|nr:DUF2997 domain-containing protein [Skermania piniformis]QXQ13328.1 DUF2997 domain-containing protein [Skermania piniformis]